MRIWIWYKEEEKSSKKKNCYLFCGEGLFFFVKDDVGWLGVFLFFY